MGGGIDMSLWRGGVVLAQWTREGCCFRFHKRYFGSCTIPFESHLVEI